MGPKKLPIKLNRFTRLDELYELIKSKTIVLTNPTKWQDKNDIKLIREYEKQEGNKVFLKCFCGGNETIHHWQSFAKSRKGCCIQFDARKLLKYVDIASLNLKHAWIDYKFISEIKAEKPPLDSYPFIKRKLYHIENEYRIVYSGTQEELAKKIPIKLDCITKITFSPLISNKDFQTKRKSLRKLLNIKPNKLKINQSTALLNRKGISLFCSIDS